MTVNIKIVLYVAKASKWWPNGLALGVNDARMIGGKHTIGIFNTTIARDWVTDTNKMLCSCKKDLQKNKQKIETSNETTQQHSQKHETRRWRGWSLESRPRKIEHTRYSKNFADKCPFRSYDQVLTTSNTECVAISIDNSNSCLTYGGMEFQATYWQTKKTLKNHNKLQTWKITRCWQKNW